MMHLKKIVNYSFTNEISIWSLCIKALVLGAGNHWGQTSLILGTRFVHISSLQILSNPNFELPLETDPATPWPYYASSWANHFMSWPWVLDQEARNAAEWRGMKYSTGLWPWRRPHDVVSWETEALTCSCTRLILIWITGIKTTWTYSYCHCCSFIYL